VRFRIVGTRPATANERGAYDPSDAMSRRWRARALVRFWPLLADHAQALGGKLYVMGAGWNVAGPAPVTMALAGILELEWGEANEPKALRVELLTEDGRPVEVPTPTGDRPVVIEGNVEVGRPPGTRRGSAFNIPIAINTGPMPIPPGGGYVWRFWIGGETRDDWRLPFSTRPVPVAPGPPPG